MRQSKTISRCERFYETLKAEIEGCEVMDILKTKECKVYRFCRKWYSVVSNDRLKTMVYDLTRLINVRIEILDLK